MTTPPPITLEVIEHAVRNAAAFRCRRRLQPAGGPGDKVFPPTYAGAVYAVEQRRIPGRDEPVTCVLLDSVQSQANRMELALQEAVDAGQLKLPLVVVDFSKWDPTSNEVPEKERLLNAVGRITSLQVPHRLADAILRDSQTADGTPFRKSEEGRKLDTVSASSATSLYRLCPTALLFGMWDSTGPKGGLGAKFERALVSEIVGVGASIDAAHRNRGVRRDPLEIRAAVRICKAADSNWSLADAKAKGAVAPSSVNHSSVPFDTSNSGTTIDYAEQVTTLSLIALRRLCFPCDGASASQTDLAARTVLASLGLCAATLAFSSGVGLRSRCLLWPEGPMHWELLEQPGKPPKEFFLDSEKATALLADAVAKAKQSKADWLDQPLPLVPQAKLVELVRKSQELATKESAEAEG
jgi:CRISPR-associated protein Csb1